MQLRIILSSLVSQFSYLPLLFLNEFYLMGLMYWHYRWSSLVNIFMVCADFIWWILLIDGASNNSTKITPTLVGYLIFIYANYFIYDFHYFIVEASQTGVLEQAYLSPYPFYFKLIGRFISGIIYCTIELILIMSILLLFYSVSIPFNIGILIPFLITLMGIAGFALIIGGTGLIFKKSHPFAYLMSNLLLFFNGSILPLENMPYFVQIVSKTLPTTQGIIVLRNMLFNNQTLLQICSNGSLLLLIANSLAYLILGLYIFNRCENKAQANGVLGHY